MSGYHKHAHTIRGHSFTEYLRHNSNMQRSACSVLAQLVGCHQLQLLDCILTMGFLLYYKLWETRAQEQKDGPDDAIYPRAVPATALAPHKVMLLLTCWSAGCMRSAHVFKVEGAHEASDWCCWANASAPADQ